MRQLNEENVEEVVLGSILIFGQEIIPLLIEKFRPELFYSRHTHKVIAGAIYKSIQQGIEIDTLNIVAMLEREGTLEAAGGRMHFTRLTQDSWTSGMVEYHLDILKDYYIKRVAEKAAMEIAELAGKKDSEVLDIQRMAGELAENILIVGGTKKANLVGAIIDEYSSGMVKKALSNDFGMTSGFHSIDEKIMGMKPAYYILAGRPGNGKTAFALNMAYRQAKKGYTVGFLSIEMSEESLLGRLTSINMKKCWYKKRTDQTDEEFKASVVAAHMDIAALPLIIDDTAHKTVEDAISAAYSMRFASKNPIDILYIDYVQLLSKTNKPEDLSHVSHKLNALKKDLGIPIFALAQINREMRE
ncbi:MAG: hypothetical protein KAH23_08935, partial [Kiritimatiellae bacterium]|nr:hypothetical protein [Kiritimatiellia bacterium]